VAHLDLQRRVAKLTSILDVAKALTAERDLDRLLGVVMTEAAKVVDADRCTLFLLDRDRGVLWSKIAQGMDAGKEIRLPLGVGIAGHVARSGEIVNLADAYADPRFNRAVDDRTGYVTRTLLCVPMRNTRGEVTGVIQALNKEGGPFTAEDEELLVALGGQAASAIENAVLNEEIQRLFEGFVKAAVVAIESRDPTTGGHSERVALLTTRLADAVELGGKGAWAGLRFGPDQRMEIRYAALLHDFGKVGVREHVLVKAEKLYPHELALLEQRFEYARRSLEAESLQRRLHLYATGAAREEHAREEASYAERVAELSGILEFVRSCNRPTVLPSGGFEKLADLRSFTFPGVDGGAQNILSEREVSLLSIPRGSLSQDERREIESHVTHTFRFLSQIPWTRGLRRVPEIAYGHHERLDGKGYPRALRPEDIGVEARMMSISDVYDALTASDRPYKKAVPHPLAIKILDEEAQRGQLDRELVDLFRDAEVPRHALGKPEAAAEGSAASA
jgi:HD-GYP domain-containing protein (c-di-GMP phosphodiesterase class II)